MATWWVLVWASVVVVMVAAADDDDGTPQNDNDSLNYDLFDFRNMGESIPMLFHKLINGDPDLTGSKTSLADSEAGIDTGEEQILAAVIQTGSMEEGDQDDRNSKSNPYTHDDMPKPKVKKGSELIRKAWVLLSYKKRRHEAASKEEPATTPEHKIHRRQKRSKSEQERTPSEHKIHRRQKRLTFKQKLRSIVVPLSVFNFLGFLPVRVPGLPYHNDLPSPDYTYYNTMHDVYLPKHRRRKGLYRY